MTLGDDCLEKVIKLFMNLAEKAEKRYKMCALLSGRVNILKRVSRGHSERYSKQLCGKKKTNKKKVRVSSETRRVKNGPVLFFFFIFENHYACTNRLCFRFARATNTHVTYRFGTVRILVRSNRSWTDFRVYHG